MLIFLTNMHRKLLRFSKKLFQIKLENYLVLIINLYRMNVQLYLHKSFYLHCKI